MLLVLYLIVSAVDDSELLLHSETAKVEVLPVHVSLVPCITHTL